MVWPWCDAMSTVSLFRRSVVGECSHKFGSSAVVGVFATLGNPEGPYLGEGVIPAPNGVVLAVPGEAAIEPVPREFGWRKGKPAERKVC